MQRRATKAGSQEEEVFLVVGGQESAVKKKKKTLEKTSRCDRFKTKAFPLPLGHFLLFFLIAFSMIKFYQIAKLLTWGPGKSKAW